MRTLTLWMLVAAIFWPMNVRAGGEAVDNVVTVLDASGSMNGPMGGMKKIDAARTALKEVLKNIPQSTHVGLLVFSASNVKDWVYPLGPRDNQKLNAAIDLPMPKAGTPLGTFMKMGADKLLEVRKAQFGYGSYRLLVVTDGEANGEPSDTVARHTRDIIRRGIVVDAIGVGMDSKHTLATKANSYRNANDPASLKRAVQEVFAEVGKTQSGSAGEDAFAAIEPIPTEVAFEVIQTLSIQPNDPIGTPIHSRSVSVTPAPGKPGDPQVPVASTGGSGPSPVEASWKSMPIIFWVIAGVVVILLLGKTMRNKQG